MESTWCFFCHYLWQSSQLLRLCAWTFQSTPIIIWSSYKRDKQGTAKTPQSSLPRASRANRSSSRADHIRSRQVRWFTQHIWLLQRPPLEEVVSAFFGNFRRLLDRWCFSQSQLRFIVRACDGGSSFQLSTMESLYGVLFCLAWTILSGTIPAHQAASRLLSTSSGTVEEAQHRLFAQNLDSFSSVVCGIQSLFMLLREWRGQHRHH